MRISFRSFHRFKRIVPVLFAGFSFFTPGMADSPDLITFNRDIRPILADSCFQCHGPDKGTREAGLRLDLREPALLGVEGRPAIVPGNAAESEVYRRITAADPAERMPPEAIGKMVTPDQVETIRKWIDQGAEYEQHWAYVAPEKRDPPKLDETGWIRTPVDAFIFQRLTEKGLSPMPEADRPTLIRRLSFDLRGLPPLTAEVDEFLADESPDAYERLVERLLSSSHYGERMAVYWLDLVRFADTVGYHGDQPTHVSPYRDYVIRAFNENKPFDQFTREQLAGDLLPDPTLDQRVATAYNRLNMVTREGGAQAKEYIAKYASDRVRTTSTVWMGSTVGCAECHDHKFDPFTAKDFYAFAAFFADIKEEGVYAGGDRDHFPPFILLPDDDQKRKLNEFDQQLLTIEAVARPLREVIAGLGAKDTIRPETRQELATYRQTTSAAVEVDFKAWLAVHERIARDDEAMEIPLIKGDSGGGAAVLEHWKVGKKEGRNAREQTGSGNVRHVADGFGPPEALQREDTVFAWVYLDPENPPTALMLHLRAAGWDHRGWWGDEAIVADVAGGNGPARRRVGDLPEAGGWVRLEVPAAQIGLNHRTPVQGIAFVQYGGRAWWGSAGFLGRQRGLPGKLIAALKKEFSERTESDRSLLFAHYVESTDLWETQKQRALIAHQKKVFEGTLPSVVTTEAVEPRVVRILPRGDWMDESGEIVEPAVPHFLPQPELTHARRLNRLDLAEWFVDPKNPLTARAMVNRFWRLYFGTGISNTLDELGNRGEWPANQELLDWLAVEFVESGWDVKHVVRMLVTSSAYRSSSLAPAPLRQIDPDNRLHARQARPRLDAEFIRDNALAISGLLVRDIGGLSVMPYQPEGYYRELNFPKREYVPSQGSDQYRRGLYTHWQRTFLHPSLMAFDAPSRDECTAERPYSNTPLQALVLLNDPTYVEAARAFATRIMTEPKNGAGDLDRIAWAWREAVSREPRESESAALLDLLKGARERYRDTPDAAALLATVGQFRSPPELDLPELAAWTAVTRTILNLQETFVRY